jgi:hypothetical protein
MMAPRPSYPLPGQIIAACAAKLADFKVPQQAEVVAALPGPRSAR